MKKPDYKNAEPQGADAGLRYLERRVQSGLHKKALRRKRKGGGCCQRAPDRHHGRLLYGRKEATLLGLGGSTLLVGKK